MHPSYKQFNYCQFSSPLESTVCDAIEYLYHEIFNADFDEARRSKLTHAEDLQVWLAFHAQQPVAFKVGYALSESVYYSWLGGVLPAFRACGIATELMDKQHRWAKEKGYLQIETRTFNQWRNMLIINLKNGFDITHTRTDERGQLKIILRKIL